jgi:hypothetical protein
MSVEVALLNNVNQGFSSSIRLLSCNAQIDSKIIAFCTILTVAFSIMLSFKQSRYFFRMQAVNATIVAAVAASSTVKITKQLPIVNIKVCYKCIKRGFKSLNTLKGKMKYAAKYSQTTSISCCCYVSKKSYSTSKSNLLKLKRIIRLLKRITSKIVHNWKYYTSVIIEQQMKRPFVQYRIKRQQQKQQQQQKDLKLENNSTFNLNEYNQYYKQKNHYQSYCQNDLLSSSDQMMNAEIFVEESIDNNIIDNNTFYNQKVTTTITTLNLDSQIKVCRKVIIIIIITKLNFFFMISNLVIYKCVVNVFFIFKLSFFLLIIIKIDLITIMLI